MLTADVAALPFKLVRGDLVDTLRRIVAPDDIKNLSADEQQ